VLKKASVLAVLMVAVGLGDAMAQEVSLSQLLTNLYGAGGLKVESLTPLPDGSNHSAHFNSSFQTSFTPFNTALASQLAAVPLPSPASGFTYTLDSSLGVFKRSTQSFGPILSDRADTIGKHKLSVGFSFQHFNFDSIDGVSLGSVPVVFTHDNPAPGGRADLVTTANSIQLKLSQFTAFLNYGLGDRVDVSLAVPFVSVDLTATSVATIQRIGTTDPRTHFFRSANGDIGSQATFSRNGAKSGVGDLIFRVKGNVYKQAGTGLALGGELRLPTGDEENLLGSGATGAEGFLVFSSSHKTLSPHVKIAYQWNGDSILAGNPDTGVKGNLPDQVFYEVGADLGLTKNLTVAVDLLGRRVIDGQRLIGDTFHALNGTSTFANVDFEKASFNIANGAVGFKFNPGGNLLIDVNVLFKLNDSGLRDKVTPLVGLEYSF
jgi:hypothetical protein